MKWLVDHNVPQGVFRVLKEFGIDAVTAEYLELEELTNGALVRKAVGLGFDCILTQDTTFATDASKALIENPSFSIILIDTTTLAQAPGGQAYIERFRRAFLKQAAVPVQGKVTRWPTTKVE